MFKTYVSVPQFAKTKEASVTLNEVFTTKFPSTMLPSPYLTLTFLALFRILNLRARHSPSTEALALVSTTTATSFPVGGNLTEKDALYCEACPTAGDVLLIHSLNPVLN